MVLGDEFIGSKHQRRQSESNPLVSSRAKVLPSYIQYLKDSIHYKAKYIVFSQQFSKRVIITIFSVSLKNFDREGISGFIKHKGILLWRRKPNL